METKNIKLNREQSKLEKFFNDNDFAVHLFTQRDEVCAEVEKWTDGGVDMIITLMPFNADSFKECVENFDVDEEVELHRQDPSYKSAFTLRKSLDDFTEFHDHLKEVAEKL